MKKIFIPVAIILVLLFAGSCKKDKNQAGAVNCRLDHILLVGTDTFDFTYNDQNQLATLFRPYTLFGFVYNGLIGNSYYVYIDTTHTLDKLLYFNAAGNLINVTVPNRDYVGDTYHGNYTFRYSADGQLIWGEQVQTDNNTGIVFYFKDSLIYSSGNLVAKYSYYRTGTTSYLLTDSLVFTYSAETNKLGNYIWGDEYMVLSHSHLETFWMLYYHLLGAGSKNLPMDVKCYDGTGGLKYEDSFQFLKNEFGYPTDETINRTGSGAYIRDYKYFYTCK